MSVHGYEAYRPSPRAASVLKASFQILAQYKAWESPMTVRQVFYRLVAEYGFGKTEAEYKSLVGMIARSRRARQGFLLDQIIHNQLTHGEAEEDAFHDHTLLPFPWIRDEKGHSYEPLVYDDFDDFIDHSKRQAEKMKMDRQAGQEQVLEIWCEAGGMVPLMKEIGAPWTVRVNSGGGYDSVTAKHKLAERVLHRAEKDLKTVVLHIGDFDPSGEGMFETLRDDVGAMCRDYGLGTMWYTIDRVALTEQQVIDMGVETAPPKAKDARRKGFVERHPEIARVLESEDITAQLEALTPPELRSLISGKIEERIEQEPYEEVLREEADLREELLDHLER